MLIWFCLYKSLQITMIKIHFAVYRLFVLDACLCWNKWKITVVKLGCVWTELLSKECKTTCYVIVNWHVHIWNSRLLQQKCTSRKGLSFIYFHALPFCLLWLFTAVTTSAVKYLLFVWYSRHFLRRIAPLMHLTLIQSVRSARSRGTLHTITNKQTNKQ